ncbi:MAG: ABC transporter permease [Flavobacteriales bacterium]|nr:ABC transporter permease [Flavobacteriales bacterium]
MDLKLILGISTTMLLARLKQSVVAGVGVTFSIMMYIALSGFMNGLNELLDGLILNRTPHIRLYNEIEPSEDQPLDLAPDFADRTVFISRIKPKAELTRVRNALGIMQALEKDERVLGIAAKTTAQVFFNVGTIDLNGVINGIQPAEEDRLFRFSDYVVSGSVHDLNAVNSVILGKGVADKMQVDLGDMVQVTTADGQRTMLKVVGTYQSGLADLDNVQCYASIKTTQKLLGRGNDMITDIQVKLHDLASAPALAREFARKFDVEALDIQTANAQFETGSNVRSIISYVVSVVLLIVAGFGIYNILNMLIYEKLDSIAILKATGFSGGDVRAIFISLSMIIGVCGGAVGLVMGYFASIGISHIPFETEALPTIKTYPVDFSGRYYLIGVAFALVTTYIAGLFPAQRASRIDPVEIIRGK